MADKYLQPPAYGEVLAMSEKQLPDSITGAAVAGVRGKAPHLPVALFKSGKSHDVSVIVRASDSDSDRWREHRTVASTDHKLICTPSGKQEL